MHDLGFLDQKVISFSIFIQFCSSKKKTTTKKRTREVKQVAKCKVTEEKDEVACLIYKDGSRYYFEFSNEDTCAEAVARINYLMGLS